MHKYVGRVVEIIYLDRKYKITQRKIEVWSAEGGLVEAYCLERRAPRVFAIDRILAVMPVHPAALRYQLVR